MINWVYKFNRWYDSIKEPWRFILAMLIFVMPAFLSDITKTKNLQWLVLWWSLVCLVRIIGQGRRPIL